MSSTSISIRAVFFDLGETLFQPLDNWITVNNVAELASSVNLSVENSDLVGQYRKLREEVTLDFAKRSFYLHKDFVNETMSRLFDHYGLEHAKHAIKDFASAQRDSVIRFLKPQTDCFSILRELRSQQYRLAIVSNIDDDWLDPLIEHWELARYVDFILSSETACSCKPDAEIFLQTSQAVDVAPQHTLFVGDSFVNDVKGSMNVGMHPVWYNPHDSVPPQEVRVPQIKTLTGLLDLL